MKFKSSKIYFLLIISLIINALNVSSFAAKKNSDFVVVIDAGHGGKDVGAVDNGVSEKDINLGVALQLEDILKKKKGFKVIMTRNSDKFIGLKERADKANKEKADLFISIHTNSLDANNANRKNVEGASVYVLGLHRDADNLAVSRRENSVIAIENNSEEKYQGFDPNKDESYIIFEMAQKKNLSQSIGLAQNVEKNLVKMAGRKSRGVHQAGFLVLRATAMPSILIELDFICNPKAAGFISSSAGQKQMARGIADAIVEYRNTLKKHGATAFNNISLDADNDNDASLFFLLPPAPETVKKKTLSANVNNLSKVNQRRRRSNEARNKSSQRNLQTDLIPVHSEFQTLASASSKAKNIGNTNSDLSSSNSNSKQQPSSVKQNKKNKNKKDKKNSKQMAKASADRVASSENVRTVGGKKVYVVSSTADSANSGSSHSRSSIKSETPNTDKTIQHNQASTSSISNKNKEIAKHSDKSKESDNQLNERVKASFNANTVNQVNSNAATSHRSLKSKKNK